MKQESVRVAVIGAGPSGLAAAKNCLEAGLEVVVFEKNNQVGGNWVFRSKTGHSSVYENTHIISSKAWSEYEDFPMPEHYPDYPSHEQLQAYFHAYAEHFGVLDAIRFETEVLQVEPEEDGFCVTWRGATAHDDDAEQTHFTHVMVANGHHWCPRHPELPGTFSGTYLHSHDFKGVNDTWRDKSVLVIGAGNSACDVAVEAARVAKSVHLSMRSPQWFLPKFMFGLPSDVLGAKTPTWFPKRLKQRLMTWLVRLLQGDYEKKYGLPKPKHPLLSHHPTVNSDLLDFIRHGRITPERAISKVDGQQVSFADGRRGEFDIIVACTGFRTVFPFFRKEIIDFEHSEKVPLYLKMMPKQWDRLYFIGLFQPLGCIWPLADYQAKLAVREIQGLYSRPLNMDKAIQHEMDNPHYRFEGGPRHASEVDYHQFRQELRSALAMSGLEIGTPPEGKKGRYKDFFTKKVKPL
ncbi:flavin-containing monooxygenase [Aliidiomarina indica]|uniref:flavin-containing monooxygenase n=1 Tax=Aliidiomarina indica TaxID=2749147 RepID=UPI00188F275D|nr:NAD(P)-binding domain-containing protein [Aliidiomarina indica]